MWVLLNTFCNRLRALSAADLSEPRLARLCSMIKEGCQTHTGITEGTFYRDEGWCFYQLGRNIERADQMTRLLDVKYHLLLPSVGDVGSPLDVSQWNALLRSAAGFHAFRREQSSGMSPQTVADFLLLNRRFPRSVQRCVQESTEQLLRLRMDFQLQAGGQAIELLEELRRRLREQEIDKVIDEGLHEYLDWVQRQLIAATDALRVEFFWPPLPQSDEMTEAAPASIAAQG